MQGTFKLLIINPLKSDISPILEVLRHGKLNPEYLHLTSDQEIHQALADQQRWDMILISEEPSGKNFPILRLTSRVYEETPVVLYSSENVREMNDSIYQKGACDCISKNEPHRLLNIIHRERREDAENLAEPDGSQENKILTEILDASTEEIYLFRYDSFSCCYANQAVVINSGYSREEIYHLNPEQIYAEYTRDTFKRLILPLMEKQRDQIGVCTKIERKWGGIFPAETLLKRIDQKEVIFILAINKDVNQQWYAVQQLKRQSNISREYIARHHQKSTLLANAAHDMRTCINSILLSNRLLANHSHGNHGTNQDKFTNAIYHSGKQLLKYLDEMVDASDRQTGDFNGQEEIVNLPDFCEELYQIFIPVAEEKGIHFEYEIHHLRQKKIITHASYLKRILKNLLSNAFKYTRHGSVAFNIYSPTRRELNRIHFDIAKAVAFQVVDTGIGISKSEQHQVFRRFHRSRQIDPAQYEGSGLGLHICKELTRMLKGDLHVESEVGIGSTFTLYLPAADAIPSPDSLESSPKKRKSTINTVAPPGKTILVADDSTIHNMVIKEFLSFSFNKCITTSRTKEIFRILKQNPVDCIVLDYLIGDTPSLDIAQQLKGNRAYAHVPVIVYTGKKLTFRERKTLNSYVNAIVQKSAGSHKILIDTIFSCLQSNPT